MVSYECTYCNNGYEQVTIIRSGKITTRLDECQYCYGAGTFTNGRPDVGWETGVTDPMWKDYTKKQLRGKWL